jgi:aryl-alcohol dehydrogenase-like predicted oxidoreductase
LNKLILGTVQFGLNYGIANQTGKVSESDSKNMLQICRTNNIRMLDTAINYGDSEKCLGALGVKTFKIVTKLPSIPHNCINIKKWVEGQFNESLKRLGVKSVYGFLLHDSDQLLGPHGASLWEAMESLKESGKVKKIGVSIYSPNELDEIFHLYNFGLIQAPFNLVDRRILKSGWMDLLNKNNIELHTRSSFLQGLLLMAKSEIPLKFSPWNLLWNKWQQWQKENDISAVEACLRFPMSFSQIDHVIVGSDSVSQLKQIISSTSFKNVIEFPDLESDDEALINPFNWVNL